MKKQPAVDLSLTAGSAKPAGPPPMPEGLSRQPAVYTARAAAVTALACSPWAPLAAVAGQKQIVLYNTDSGQLLGVLPFPEGIPHVLKFSRSGSLLLAGGGIGAKSGSVVVFDVKTGKRVFEVGDELDIVLAADINEDHTRIALGGPGRVVRIFSTADGSQVGEIRKHTEWIYALEFSPDGVLLATADRAGGMFVWESETAREFQNLAGHKGAITDVSWRGDSNVLASSSEDGTVKLWEMEGGKEIKNWAAHAGGASSVEFSHDGKLVTVGRDRLTKIWDGNGAAIRELAALGDLAMEVAFTHDAARVVAGDWLGEVRLSDVADGKQVALLVPNPPTLEMLVQAQTAAAAAAVALCKKRPPNRRLRSPSRKRRLPTRPRQRPRRKRLPPTWRLPKRSWSKRPRPAKRQPTPLRPRKPACRACWPKRPPSRNRSRRKPPSRSKRCAKST